MLCWLIEAPGTKFILHLASVKTADYSWEECGLIHIYSCLSRWAVDRWGPSSLCLGAGCQHGLLRAFQLKSVLVLSRHWLLPGSDPLGELCWKGSEMKVLISDRTSSSCQALQELSLGGRWRHLLRCHKAWAASCGAWCSPRSGLQ